LLNRKILLAPFLAVALVMSLATAVTYLPASPQASLQNSFSPESSPHPYYNITPSTGSASIQTPVPSPAPAATPTTVPASTTASVNLLPILSVVAAVVLGIVAALAFFSERGLKKELGDAQLK